LSLYPRAPVSPLGISLIGCLLLLACSSGGTDGPRASGGAAASGGPGGTGGAGGAGAAGGAPDSPGGGTAGSAGLGGQSGSASGLAGAGGGQTAAGGIGGAGAAGGQGPAPHLATKVVVFLNGTCALLDEGTVRCWGNNDQRQLGSPTGGNVLSPTYVSGASITPGTRLSPVADLARSTAVVNGQVMTWPAYGDAMYVGLPSPRVGISAAVAVGATNFAGGWGSACALLADGTVTCWSNTRWSEFSPLGAISGVAGALTVAVGPTHACAVIADGSARCWGANDSGQLGDGTTTAPPTGTATTVVGLSDARAIFVGGGDPDGAGDANACAQKADLSVWCWGNDSHGQFGSATLGLDPANPIAATPIAVAELQGARSLALGGDHACAVFADGIVRCTASTSPGGWIAVPGIQDAVSVATCADEATGHSCALIAGGSIMCWGSDTFGQLGDGNYSPTREPLIEAAVRVLGL